MKKQVLVVIVIVILVIVALLLFKFLKPNNTVNPNGGNTPSVTGKPNSKDESEEKVENPFEDGYISYKEPDFTDVTDFKVETSNDVKDVAFDAIMLHDYGSAQLDLKFDKDRVGTLSVSNTDNSNSSEEATVKDIADTEVSYVEGIDQIKHYYWEKDGMYFSFATKGDFSDEELAKIIKGYSVNVGE
jgi:hypothetical protein